MARLRHTLNDYSKQQSTKIVVECGVYVLTGSQEHRVRRSKAAAVKRDNGMTMDSGDDDQERD